MQFMITFKLRLLIIKLPQEFKIGAVIQGLDKKYCNNKIISIK